MSGSLQLPCAGSKGTRVEKEVIHSSPRVDTVEVKEFHLDNVQGPVCTTLRVTIPPIWYNQCTWQYQCQGTLYVGPPADRANARPPVAFSSGAICDLKELHLGSSQGSICLCNLIVHSIEIPTKTVVGQVVPANQVPLVVLPAGTLGESISNPQKGWILEALDLQGLGNGPNLSKKRPGNCCLNGNSCLPTVTWTWVELP